MQEQYDYVKENYPATTSYYDTINQVSENR